MKRAGDEMDSNKLVLTASDIAKQKAKAQEEKRRKEAAAIVPTVQSKALAKKVRASAPSPFCTPRTCRC